MRILFTSGDLGKAGINIFKDGLGLWVFYTFTKYLTKQGIPYVLGDLQKTHQHQESDVYTLYLRTINSGMEPGLLLGFLEKHQITAIIPTEVSDTAYLSRLKALGMLSDKYQILVSGDPNVYDFLDNKMKLDTFARIHSISVPETLDSTNFNSWPLFATSFPLYLKRATDSKGGLHVFKVKDQKQLKRLLKKTRSMPMILQKAVSGQVYSVDCLFYKGKLVGSFAKTLNNGKHVVSRTNYLFPKFTPHLTVSKEIHQQLVPLINKIGLLTDYTGMCDLEFIISKETKEVYLLEVNPRFSGGCYSWIDSDLWTSYLDLLLNKSTAEREIAANPRFFSKSDNLTPLTNLNILKFYCKNSQLLLNLKFRRGNLGSP